MKDRLRALIDREDKRNPLTDQQLANSLNLRREEVTLLRKELSIPDSRQRRKNQLLKDVKDAVTRQPDISVRALTQHLQQQGYQLSRHVAGKLLEEAQGNQPTKKHSAGETTAFANLIGYQGSLRTQIQQAKAAVIYPPAGLHTLILGESGVGKSELAEAMYRYSIEVGVRPETAPFVVFNCSDYAENPQLLITQLFGHVRGAYTGATDHKSGLVEKADGGILFLDEIHRLPPEGQEILYSIIDKGTYRRLGETENNRRVSIMLVGATTENIDSALLLPFRRRIPMVIEIPPLRSRPLNERLALLRHFFRQESTRVGKSLEVQRDVIKALMSGEKPGNVGQLKSDVQVACARAFLNHIGNEESRQLTITINELSNGSRKSLLVSRDSRELEGLLLQDEVFYPESGQLKVQVLKDNIYGLPDEIYQYIEEQVNRYREQGLSLQEVSNRVSQELEKEFTRLIRRIEHIKPSLSRCDLEKLIRSDIAAAASEMVSIASDELDLDAEPLFFYLAIHLSTVVERIFQGQPIINPQLAQVKKEYPAEYLCAIKMAAVVKRHFGLELPEDEIGFIALYLRTFRPNNDSDEGRVAVLVLSHGRIAREMVNVVNALLKVDYAHSLDMALTESPDSFLERVVEFCRRIDQGKGVLLLVDMGSLVAFGELVQERLGIPVRAVDRVDLVMVLEATRRAVLANTTLDELADDLVSPKHSLYTRSSGEKKAKLLLTTCLSGYGGAEKIKSFLTPHLQDFGVEIKSVGVMEESRLKRKVERWQKDYRIVAVVGTIDPELPDIPFIPFQSVTNGPGLEYLKSMFFKRTSARLVKSKKVISKRMILPRLDMTDKGEIIRSLSELLSKNGYVKPGYLESVLSREEFAPTCVEGGIAIPHGEPEYVIKPGIAVATLATPINWWGLEVDVVFLLAVRVVDRQLVVNLRKLFQDKEKMQIIRSANAAAEIKEVVSYVIT